MAGNESSPGSGIERRRFSAAFGRRLAVLWVLVAGMLFPLHLEGCNQFSHAWSLTGLEENTTELPRLALAAMLRRLPLDLASSAKDIPWLQTASCVQLVSIDAATYPWSFRTESRSSSRSDERIEVRAGDAAREPVFIPVTPPESGKACLLGDLNPVSTGHQDLYEFLQRRASETGACVAALEIIGIYQSLGRFVDLLPIRLTTIRIQSFERIEVLVRLAGPRGDICLIGPLKSEVTLSTDIRVHPGSAYIGRFEWRSDEERPYLVDLTPSASGVVVASSSSVLPPMR